MLCASLFLCNNATQASLAAAPAMKQPDAMLRILETEASGGAADPDVAIANIASLLERLDPAAEGYEKDVADLLAVGACIWALSKRVG